MVGVYSEKKYAPKLMSLGNVFSVNLTTSLLGINVCRRKLTHVQLGIFRT